MSRPLSGLGSLIVCFLCAGAAGATDIYVAQNAAGGDTGASCATAHAAVWFNTAGNWGTGAAQVGPGDIVHLCGTLTSQLTVQASGTSAAAITILFETGAKLSQPACPFDWGGSSGCLYTNNKTFLVIDGGTNGIIEDTANGTGLGNAASVGVGAMNCSNCEIKNLTIQNIYKRTSTTDTNVDQTLEQCIVFSGSNLKVHNNVCHDLGWALNNSYNDGDTNVRVYNNEVYNIDHGYILAAGGAKHAGPFYFYNNHVHDYAVWDSATNFAHHDGIHAFGSADTNGVFPVVSDFYIYNNLFDGTIGNNITGHIFLEGGSGTGRTPWTDATGVAHVFNNVFVAIKPIYGIVQLYKGHNFEVYNNTIIGSTPTDGTCLEINETTNPKVRNNFISGCNILLSLGTTPVATPAADINNNVYANCSGSFNCWWWNATDTANFATWQSATGADPNSVNSITTSGNLDSTGHPLTGSPVIGAGANLTSLGNADLKADKAGTARPASAAWDSGAYQFGSTPPPPPAGSVCDVNKDGSTNVADVQGEVNQALGTTSCTADINQDAKCNVIDVQRVVNAALGGACVATP